MPDQGSPRIVLWGAGTGRTLRPHWALHELGLEYDARLTAPRSGETLEPAFLALNPRHKVPVLQEGDFVLAESAAIVTYLGDAHGGSSGLVPAAGTHERGLYEQWCYFAMTELDSHTLHIIHMHTNFPDRYGEAPAAVETARRGYLEQVAAAESHLAKGRDWLLDTGFSGADILLTTCLDWAHTAGLPVEGALAEYRQRARERPAYRAAARLNYSVRPDGTPRPDAS